MRSLKYIYGDLDVSSNFSLLSFQPSLFQEAIRAEKWVQDMDEEIEAIEKNDTWDLVDLSKDKNFIGVKLVYKTKLNDKVLSIAAQNKWKVYQMDVKSTFFNGIKEEEIYLQQPSSYEFEDKEDKFYRLKKALYGLKQAPRDRMENCKPVPTAVAIGTKLSKDEEGLDVNPTLFKRFVGSLVYLTATRPDIM
eukprot:PITA_31596